MSIHWPILKRLLAHPRRVCVVDDQRQYRGLEIVLAAFHVADAIQSQSSSRTIGLLLPTSGAFPIAALAGWILGRTVVPLNYLLKPDELRFVIEDCGTDTVVTIGPMLEFLGGAETPALKGIRQIRMDQINFRAIPDARWPASAADEDLALLLYTSGTSGRPKGVMLTHGNIRANIDQVCRLVHFTQADGLLGVLPQFHSFGLTVLTLLPLSIGCRAVFTSRFVPGRLVRLMREHRPTAFIAIPSMYNALLHAKDAAPADFASLRLAVSGGEPLPSVVLEGFRERFGITLCEGYGLTETAPVTNICLPHEFVPACVGSPMPGVTERIVDLESGQDLPPGRDGEIRIGGPNVMRGYYNRPEETAAAFDERGFLKTGDIGRFDLQGRLYITGRLKEMLIVGGENVFPREIEEVLNRHPSVKDSGVVGMTDPVRGELPLAFVELKDEATFDEKSLLAWCRQHLAGYKVPRQIKHMVVLPRNPTGKVMRRELKKIAATDEPDSAATMSR